jgi:MFS family permease
VRRSGRDGLSRRLSYALAALAAAQAAVYVARPLTSYRLLAVGAGAREIGLVAAAFALLPLFLAIPLGRVADRRHDRPLLVGGCSAQVVACLLLGWAKSPLGLAAASALLGLGHLGLALGVQAVIARESDPAHHDQHFGLLTAAVSLGQLAGPLLGGFMLGDRTGRDLVSATTHAMVAAAGIAAVAVALAVLAERGRHGRTHEPLHGVSVTRLGAVLGVPGVPAAIFASVAVLAAADVFTAYLPALADDRGIAPRAVGVLLALRAATSIAARVGIGGIVSRVGRLRLITLSAFVSAASFAGVALTGDVLLLALLSAVAGFALGFGQPLSMTMVVQLAPEHARGTALALRLMGNRIGQVAAPALAGIVAGSAGAGSVFWLLAAMLIASGVAIRAPAAVGVPDAPISEEPLN